VTEHDVDPWHDGREPDEPDDRREPDQPDDVREPGDAVPTGTDALLAEHEVDQVDEQGEAAEQPADPRVAAAVRRLEELSELPPEEHVEVYESMHRSLQESLAEAAQPDETNPPHGRHQPDQPHEPPSAPS
jgi:hypothetical protein